ncbi:divalent-cation tolerance protein CutA [Methylomonas sp. MK1]|jgi:periplasmic divalent cation tolerance protein|uniref:divalent-cation tolerance protein CutA n=1 Tax=Methylomonas sp. MK1 TaxID=1131552 RepID=UPI00036CABB1|nr:divalent-cation tolerance protein CutA [Methylomonas sp. MK1]
MYQLILCTCPDVEVADKLAGALITQKLAACVNILPGVRSVYEWQGKIEAAQEHLLLIKSHQDRYAAIEATLKSLHPYQLPEIIAVAIESGSLDYLKWIDSCLGID